MKQIRANAHNKFSDFFFTFSITLLVRNVVLKCSSGHKFLHCALWGDVGELECERKLYGIWNPKLNTFDRIYCSVFHTNGCQWATETCQKAFWEILKQRQTQIRNNLYCSAGKTWLHHLLKSLLPKQNFSTSFSETEGFLLETPCT